MAKHAAPAKKLSARVNPIIYVFISPIEHGFSVPVNVSFKLTNRKGDESKAMTFGRSTTTDSLQNRFGGKFEDLSWRPGPPGDRGNYQKVDSKRVEVYEVA